MDNKWSDEETASPLDIAALRKLRQQAEEFLRAHEQSARELKAVLDRTSQAAIAEWLSALRAVEPQTPQCWLGIEALTQYLRDGTVPNL